MNERSMADLLAAGERVSAAWGAADEATRYPYGTRHPGRGANRIEISTPLPTVRRFSTKKTPRLRWAASAQVKASRAMR